jgi:hypothetical protein
VNQEKEREVMNLEVELEAMKAAEISLKQEAKHLQQELARTKAALSARDLQVRFCTMVPDSRLVHIHE